MIIREYKENDLQALISIWNEVVAEGNAFPQEEPLEKSRERSFSLRKVIAEWRTITEKF